MLILEYMQLQIPILMIIRAEGISPFNSWTFKTKVFLAKLALKVESSFFTILTFWVTVFI